MESQALCWPRSQQKGTRDEVPNLIEFKIKSEKKELSKHPFYAEKFEFLIN